MLDSKTLNEIAKQLSDAMPESVRSMQNEMQQTFHTILQGTFKELDLVTRDEFDTQVKVLARTRAKLEALEKQLAELEAPGKKNRACKTSQEKNPPKSMIKNNFKSSR